MRGFLAYLELQARLLRARLLPRFMLLGVLAAAALPVLVADAAPERGFAVLADAVGLVVSTVVILSVVLAAVSFSGDSSSGALRTLLVRPIPRSTLICGQALMLGITSGLLYIIGVLVAWFLTARLVGFAHISHEGYEILSLEVMESYARRLVFLPLPALLCAPLVALAVSSIVDDVALSVVVSLALVMGPFFFSSISDALPRWFFTEQAHLPVEILRDLARGIETHAAEVDAGVLAREATLYPLGFGAGVLALALLFFNLRDFKS